jgi:PH domain/Variant SH3 domain/Calponin homology (CH) domain
MPQAVNTMAEAVFRPDGTQVFGIDAELELKMQASRDVGFEQGLVSWVQAVVRKNPDKAAKVGGKPLKDFAFKDPEDIFASLKNGVALCHMMNAIEPGSVRKVDDREIGIVHMANIDMYLKACWKLGLPSGSLFLASDLFRGKSLSAVIQNLYAVAKLATERKDWGKRKMPPLPDNVKGGGQVKGGGGEAKGTIALPTKEDEERRIAASKPAKKWAPVTTAPDFGQNQAEVSAVCGSCQEAMPVGSKFCKSCGSKAILQDSGVALEELRKEHAVELEKVQGELESARKKLAAAAKSRDDKSLAADKLSQDVEAGVKREKDLKRKIEKLEAQNAELQSKYDAAVKRAAASAKAPMPAPEQKDTSKADVAKLEEKHRTEIDWLENQQEEALAKLGKGHEASLRKVEQEREAESKALAQKLAGEQDTSRDLRRKLQEATARIKELEREAKGVKAKYSAERKAREEWADRYHASIAHKRKTARLSVLRASMDESAGAAASVEPAAKATASSSDSAPDAAPATPDFEDDFVLVLSDEEKDAMKNLVAVLVSGEFKPMDSKHRSWTDICVRAQKAESGRREFATQIRRELKQAQTNTVSEQCFGVLLNICDAALTEVDAAANKELFTVKKLVRIVTGVYHETKPKPGSKAAQVFMFETPSMKAHNVWRDHDFWEFMFNDEIFRKYTQYFPDETEVDPDFVMALVCTYVLQMNSQWGLSTEFVSEFVRAILHSSTFALKDPDAVEKRLAPFVKSGGKQHGEDEPSEREAAAADDGVVAAATAAALLAVESQPKTRPRKAGGSKNKDSEAAGGGSGFLKSTLRGLSKKESKIEMPKGKVVKQGQLAKKGHARKNWKLRWFVLKTGALVYMEKATPNPNATPDIIGIVSLRKCFAAPSPSDRRPFTFVISSGADGVEYLLDADNVSNMHSWLDAIRGAIVEPLDAVERGVAAAQSEHKPAGNTSLMGAAVAGVSGLGVVSRAEPAREEAETKADAAEAAAAAAKSDSEQPARKQTSRANVVCHAIATDTFTGEARTELSVKKGDRVSILKKDNSGWWLGMCGDKKGWFPAEYVQEE